MDVVQVPLRWMVFLFSLVHTASTIQILNGTFGGSMTFDVTVPIPVNHRIQWAFGEIGDIDVIALVSDGETPLCSPQYRGRCEMSSNGTLRLDNMTYADDGYYSLFVFDEDDFDLDIVPHDLQIFSILREPSLSLISDLTIDGSNVTLHCDVEPNQNVTAYIFYRDQSPICSEPHVTCQGSYLDFTPISESDSGSYTCTIQNPVSSNTSNSLNVTVSVPVSAVTLTSNTSDLLLWPGRDSVSLRCSSNGTEVSYSWSLDGEPLPQDPQYQMTRNNSELIITPNTTKEYGYFMCTAKNWINSDNSTGLYLSLASPVSAVTVTSNTSGALWAGQDSVSLYCTAQGSAISFSWSLNGKHVSSNPPYYITQSDSPQNSNLIISPVSKNDNGAFTCTASNRINSETSIETNLNINWNPEGHVLYLAKPGEDDYVVLGCSWPGGNPPANVTMVFNNTSRTAQTNVTSNVSRDTIPRGSELTCVGERMGKTSLHSVVLEPPQSLEHNSSTIINIEDGETTAMTVTLLSGLPAEFTWVRLNPDPVPVQTGGRFTVDSNSSRSSLLVSQATVSESGVYECRVRNVIGSQNYNFTLRVTPQGNVHTIERKASDRHKELPASCVIMMPGGPNLLKASRYCTEEVQLCQYTT
ncbi:carcinoembryonic antigen-related cell adhesion molecule 1-like [Dendropsophus ebraccatus]|uniref:carcinoembryonic antigen-related cell adhesion molecule 1-like n=1 Tax=Dendropsophus ebraccatus TaxID=150705 RepID=UPI0038312A1A